MAVGPWPDAGAVPSGHALGPGFRPGLQDMPQGRGFRADEFCRLYQERRPPGATGGRERGDVPKVRCFV